MMEGSGGGIVREFDWIGVQKNKSVLELSVLELVKIDIPLHFSSFSKFLPKLWTPVHSEDIEISF